MSGRMVGYRWLTMLSCASMLAVGVVPAVADDEVRSPPPAVSVDDPLRPFQWNLDRIRAPEAWGITQGDPDVTIAIIDTGVDPDHRDLAGALWTHPVTGAHGFDHVRGVRSTFVDAEQDWHGTAIAGIAAARADDGYGIAGVAPDASIMVHRIYASASATEPPTQTSYALASAAIRDAAAAGADVILLTWGGTTPNAELATAIEDSGVPVVAAAGNDGQDLSDRPSVRRYPAMYRLPNLVTVAATDRDSQILDNGFVASNYGVRHVDIAAPGDGLLSITAGAEHGIYDGTSFAAPQVAGALALGRSLAPGVSTNELVAMLISTSRRHVSLRDQVTSGGVLDIVSFLRVVERPVCRATIPPSSLPDLDRSSPHFNNISCVVWYGVSQGTGDGFAANRTITRGETATLLVRLLDASGHELPEQPTTAFDDIAGTTHETSIRLLADLGLVAGVGDGAFAPHRPVTRAQMATLVVGVLQAMTEVELASDRDWFDDVDGNVHATSIAQAREAGITLGGAEPREFSPNLDITRAQMASFLARTMDATGRQGVTIERLP